MYLVSALLIGLSTNIDNFCMATIIGIRGRKMSVFSNLAIAVISFLASFIACTLANFLTFSKISNILGCLLIIAIGAWTIVSSVRHQDDENQEIETLGVKQTLLAGLALALNCIPVAFAAGATGISPILISASIAAFSFISMDLGVRVGIKLGKQFNITAVNAFSGVILIVIGFAGLLI